MLNVSPQAVADLMKRGKLTRYEFFGSPWIAIHEIRARIAAPKASWGPKRPGMATGGRPRKLQKV